MIHISHEHKQVVVPYRPEYATLFPHGQVFQWNGLQHMVVPHGIEETKLFRNLNLPVPPPIVEHYKFTGNVKPFGVQIKTAAAMTMNPRFYCLNAMGTGKTKSALWAYDYLRSQGLVRKLLIVCPVSIMDFTWRREIMDTLPGTRVAVLYGTKDKRLKILAGEWDIAIINHDGLGVIEGQLIQNTDIDVVVIDEAAMFRNARAARSKVARSIIANKKFVWAMTGQPCPNEPTDAFGLAKLVTPFACPRSFVFFRQDVMTQVSQFRWVPKKDAADKVAKLLQPSVRFELNDVVELPDLIERTLDVPQSLEQKEAYQKIKEYAALHLKEGSITAVNGGVVLQKCLQISCGYVYRDDGSVHHYANDDRLEMLEQIAEGTTGKVIVFSPWIHSAEGIGKFLEKRRMDYATVTGAVSQSERTRIFSLFQDSNRYKILNAHPGCMAHGLTLTSADTIVWFAPISSLETFEQANARIRRIGQRKKQQVIMLQGTFAERQAYQRLRTKRDVQDSVLDILSEIVSQA
jgi:SNF2 family DNA or RNA helicase